VGWNDFVYGQQYDRNSGYGCGCGGNQYGNQFDRKFDRHDDRKRCDGRDLLRGISKNDFIKVFLKNSRPVEGFFAGVSKNILTLFDCERRRVSTIDICLEDIVAIKSFGDRFDDDHHDSWEGGPGPA
jgi:hypothetical protein